MDGIICMFADHKGIQGQGYTYGKLVEVSQKFLTDCNKVVGAFVVVEYIVIVCQFLAHQSRG